MRENCRRISRKEKQRGWKNVRFDGSSTNVTSSSLQGLARIQVFERIYLFIERIEELEGSTLKATNTLHLENSASNGKTTEFENI